jgi:hypothetical protein
MSAAWTSTASSRPSASVRVRRRAPPVRASRRTRLRQRIFLPFGALTRPRRGHGRPSPWPLSPLLIRRPDGLAVGDGGGRRSFASGALPVGHDQRVMNSRPDPFPLPAAQVGVNRLSRGKSCGSSRQEQPARSRYRIASTISRFGARRGRPPCAASGIIGSSPPIGRSSGRSDRRGACGGASAIVASRVADPDTARITTPMPWESTFSNTL